MLAFVVISMTGLYVCQATKVKCQVEFFSFLFVFITIHHVRLEVSHHVYIKGFIVSSVPF